MDARSHDLEVKICLLYFICSAHSTISTEQSGEGLHKVFDVFDSKLSLVESGLVARHRLSLASAIINPMQKSQNVDLDVKCMRFVLEMGFGLVEESNNSDAVSDNYVYSTKIADSQKMKEDIRALLTIMDNESDDVNKSSFIIDSFRSKLIKVFSQDSNM